jgi:tetratricopeptide (TPR) repeat protein
MKRLPIYMLFIMLIFCLPLTACSISNYFISNQALESGNMNYDMGNYEEAAALYDKAIKANRNNATAYGNKSAALNFLEKYEEALEMANKALEINPRDAMLHLNKGDALSSLGEYEKAIECFNKAIEIDPVFVDALKSKGDAYYNMNEYEESLEEYNKAIHLDSSIVDAYLSKAQVFVMQEKYVEALDVCDSGIYRDKKNPDGYSKKAEILLAMNRQEDAFAALNIAIALDKNNVDKYLSKMAILYDLKNYEECISFGEGLLNKFPENEDINWYIADSYSAMSAHDKAVKYYKEVLKINPQNDQVATYAGWEYFYLQDYVNAQKYADTAQELYRDSYDTQSLQEELKKTKLTEAERIVDFVKNNYLYIRDNKNFEDKTKDFIKDENVTAQEIQDYIKDITIEKDSFTFVVAGDEYDYVAQEGIKNQITNYELDSDIYYIRIDSFTPTTGSDFRKALDKINDTKNKNLVIDLRGNSGGLINSSNDILDYLLPACSTCYTIDRNGYIESYYSNKSQISFKSILVLVDENTASSAELLTLGLKKYLDNVVVIGRPTFGKGVGQNIYEDRNKKYMIFLVSFYWNVKEENIAGSRIYPDVKINSNSNEYYIRAIKAQIK